MCLLHKHGAEALEIRNTRINWWPEGWHNGPPDNCYDAYNHPRPITCGLFSNTPYPTGFESSACGVIHQPCTHHTFHPPPPPPLLFFFSREVHIRVYKFIEEAAPTAEAAAAVVEPAVEEPADADDAADESRSERGNAVVEQQR